MPGYAVESTRQPMTATGIVNPVMEWDEMPDGKRRPSDRPARDENTGMPLHEVEVFYTHSHFGREYTTTGVVRVGAAEKPEPAPLTPISFTGLSVRVQVNKSGGFSENWTAESITDSTSAGKPGNGTSASATGASSKTSTAAKSDDSTAAT